MKTSIAVGILFLCLEVEASPPVKTWIQKIPTEGKWSRYELTSTGMIPFSGTVTLSSVGSEMIKGQTTSWIEIKCEFDQEEPSPIDMHFKLLVREVKHGCPKTTYVKALRAWYQTGDATVHEIKRPMLDDSDYYNDFLAWLLMENQETETTRDNVMVKCGVGKLRCRQISSTRDDSEDATVSQAYSIRERRLVSRNDSVPFCVPRFEITLERVEANQRATSYSKTILELVEIGTDAKPEIKITQAETQDGQGKVTLDSTRATGH